MTLKQSDGNDNNNDNGPNDKDAADADVVADDGGEDC